MLTRTVFTDSALQSAIDRAAAEIPVGHSNGIVAHADLTGLNLTAIIRAGDVWTIQANVTKPWNGPLSAQADLIASW